MDSSRVDLSELLDIVELQGLCESLSALTATAVGIVDLAGKTLVVSGWRRICSQFHRVHETTAACCRLSDTVLAGQLHADDPCHHYCCENGLVEIAWPIVVDGECVAHLFAGQFLLAPAPREAFARRARQCGFDEQAYLAALDEVPIHTLQQLGQMTGLLGRLAQLVGEAACAKRGLRQVEERFALASDAARLGVWDWLVADNHLLWDERMHDMHGLAREDFDGTCAAWQAAMHPDDRPHCCAQVEKALRGDATFDAEFRVLRPGGEERHLKASAVVLRDAKGAALRMTGVCYDVTEHRQTEITLHSVMAAANDAIVVLDPRGLITYWNRAACDILGYSTEEALGRNLHALIVPQRHLAAHQAAFAGFQSSGQGTAIGKTMSLHARRKDGQEIVVEISLASVRRTDGWHAIGIIRDRTERQLWEDKLQLAATAFTHAREGILIAGADGAILDVNEAFVDITGYRREDVLGRSPRLFRSEYHDRAFFSAQWRELAQRGYWSGEIWNRRKNGEAFPAMLTISVVCDREGKPQHYLALFSDISTLKAQQKQLEHIVHYDALTTLPNRVLLADRLHQAMVQAQRHRTRLAVAYLDLDAFKQINDLYGHEVGDQLLVGLAARLAEVLREGDTLARIGGDEFVVVLPDLNDMRTCEAILNRLLYVVAQPIVVDGQQHQVSACLGATSYPQADEVDADQLLRQADQAMYQAKQAGKNRFHFFDAEQDRSVRGHHESLERIRRALDNDEFVLHYQPKVNMRSGQVIGVEALIRWQHPERGLLAPAAFLSVVEDHPLAIGVGEWVIHHALEQIERWQRIGLYLPVSVNIGAYQLQSAGFVDRVRAILAAHPGAVPGQLTMEILETSALEDLSRVSTIIEDCQALGIDFALDDFGTGYSSLTYLKRLPVKLLKVDQSFVRDLLDDPDDLAILQGILGLAAAFRRQVIAEGVELVEHGELLLKLGCELAQGYGIARPMPAAEVPGWVATWRPDPAWSERTPAHRDDLPLLFARAEHNAWTSELQKYLAGECAAAPTLDHYHCRLGQWLASDGKSRYGALPAFQAVVGTHQRLHAAAAQLCTQYSAAAAPDAGELGEFERLLDTLIDETKVLLG